MKYTIEGFQQDILTQYSLDCTDAVILRYIIDFWLSGKMQKHEHDGESDYFWMSYKTIIEELPIIKIKKQALADRMQKFVDCGLMKFYLWKSGQGTFTHYKIIPEKYAPLVSGYEPVRSEVRTPVRSRIRTKYSSTIPNSSTEDITKIRNDIKMKFTAINPDYYHDKKQVGCIEKILSRTNCNLNQIYIAADKLKAITETEKAPYWRNCPVTPAMLLSRWDQVMKWTSEPERESQYELLGGKS
jgi:hypothetical protein